MMASRGLICLAPGPVSTSAAVCAKQLHVRATDRAPDDLPRLQGGERIIAAGGEVGSGMFPKTLSWRRVRISSKRRTACIAQPSGPRLSKRLPPGQIVAIIRGGAPHVGPGGRLDLIRSNDGGRTWSKPKSLPRTSDDDRGAAIGQTPDGALLCTYRIYDAYDEHGKHKKRDIDQYTMLTRSSDGGQTWAKPGEVRLPGPDFVATRLSQCHEEARYSAN